MKRLLATVAALILTPLTAFAISMNDLTSNPDQYKKIYEDANNIIYLDVYSVESLRYSPPYYTMRGHFYGASYSNNVIYDFILTADYNYNRSMKTIINKLLAEERRTGRTKSFDESYAEYRRQVAIDSGISVNGANVKTWDIDGNFIEDNSPINGHKVEFNSFEQIMASQLFKQYYNETF